MQKNTTLLEMSGWMGRLAFIFNGLKASLILLLPTALFVYFYLDHATKLIEADANANPSGTFLAGAFAIGIVYYALIFPSIVKRLRDIVGKDLKSPYWLAIVIVIGLNIPFIGLITGLVLISYPGIYSKAAAADDATTVPPSS